MDWTYWCSWFAFEAMAMNEFVSTVMRIVLNWQLVYISEAASSAIRYLHDNKVADDQEE